MSSSWDALAELAERELALVEQGRYAELGELARERAALIAALPASAPPSAGPALRRALETQGRVTELLATETALAGAELERLNRGRAAMRAYASGVPARPVRRLVDRAG